MKKLFLTFCIFGLCWPNLVFAQSSNHEFSSREVKGRIADILSDQEIDGQRQMIFTVWAEDELEYEVDTSSSYLEGLRYDLEIGDRVILQILQNMDGSETAQLSDVVRTKALFWLILFFSLLIIAVGLWRGLLALLGLTVTIIIIFTYLFPSILAGADPLISTVVAAVLILIINIPLTHGLSKISTMAFLGTLGGLVSSVVFAKLFIGFADLSGLANDEAIFFSWGADRIDPRGILLAAIILGAVGIFDDVAITQAESVAELKKANPQMARNELFKSAMRIGRHHIASMVNTLVLAYVAVAMPLFLLFMKSNISFENFVNIELVAEEIVWTLAGTSALILTVPFSTWLAAFILTRKPRVSFDNLEIGE